MGARNRSVVLAAATLTLALPLLPAAASTVDDPASAVADAFAWLGASEADAATVAAAAFLDGREDTFRYAEPGATPATLDEAYGDITAFVGAPVVLDGKLGAEQLDEVPCGQTAADGAVFLCADPSLVDLTSPHWAWVMTLAGDIPTGDLGLHQSLAIPLLSDGGTPWEPQGSFLWDTYQGTDTWYEVTRAPGASFTFGVTSADDFSQVASGAIAIIRGASLIVLVPEADLGYLVADLDHVVAAGAGFTEVLAAPALIDPTFASPLADHHPTRAPCGGGHQHTHDGTFGATGSDRSVVDAAPDTNTSERRTPKFLFCSGATPIRIGGPSTPPVLATPIEPATEPATATTAPTDVETTPPSTAPADTGSSWMIPVALTLLALVVVGLFFGGLLNRGGTRTRTNGEGTGTRDGGDDEEEPDDDDPRDVPAPVLYGEEIDRSYAYEVKLVTGGNFTDLATASNTTQTLLAAPPGCIIVGTYFVAFRTQVTTSTATARDVDKVQVRGPGTVGYDAEAALTDDPEADLWTDRWFRKETERRGYRSEGGDSLYASSEVDAKRIGWTEEDPYTSDTGSTSKYPELPVRKAGAKVAATGVLRTVVEMSVQFRPEGPAADYDGHLFGGKGESYLRLKVRSRCAWCKSSYESVGQKVCEMALSADASAGFHVEGESHSGGTTFEYTNETNETKLKQEAKAAKAGLSLAMPKAGVSVGAVTITEVGLALTPSSGHEVERKAAPPNRRDQYAHNKALRNTLRASSSTTTETTMTELPNWKGEGRATAFVSHTLELHGEVDAAWPFPEARPELTVHLEQQEGQGHGRVMVQGNPVPVHSPSSEATGTYWWKQGPETE